MGELFLELKPLGVVAAVVAIVWLTAISDPPRREAVFEERYAEVSEPEASFDGVPEGWGLVNVEVEAE